MSTRCQIEFRSGGVRRTIYRHWDGYPSAVIPDLLAFLTWSTRRGDVEYESANFLYWSKRDMEEQSVQLGFGICANDELHGDVEYYYDVEHTAGGAVVRAHAVERDAGVVRIGRVLREVAVPQPFFSSYRSARPIELLQLIAINSGPPTGPTLMGSRIYCSRIKFCTTGRNRLWISRQSASSL